MIAYKYCIFCKLGSITKSWHFEILFYVSCRFKIFSHGFHSHNSLLADLSPGWSSDLNVLRGDPSVDAHHQYSRVCQQHGQRGLLDPRWSVESHRIDPLQQLRFSSVDGRRWPTKNRNGGRRNYVPSVQGDSQSQLFKTLHGGQRRVGVRLKNLHLIVAVHHNAAEQLLQQWLFRRVHFVSFFPSVALLGVQVSCSHRCYSNIAAEWIYLIQTN